MLQRVLWRPRNDSGGWPYSQRRAKLRHSDAQTRPWSARSYCAVHVGRSIDGRLRPKAVGRKHCPTRKEPERRRPGASTGGPPPAPGLSLLLAATFDGTRSARLSRRKALDPGRGSPLSQRLRELCVAPWRHLPATLACYAGKRSLLAYLTFGSRGCSPRSRTRSRLGMEERKFSFHHALRPVFPNSYVAPSTAGVVPLAHSAPRVWLAPFRSAYDDTHAGVRHA